MRKVPKRLYETGISEIERKIEALRLKAASLPPGEARQAILVEAAKFRVYADVKSWFSGPPIVTTSVMRRKEAR